MFKEFSLSFRRLSIFKKILFSFIAITIIPSIISLIISVKTTENLIITQTYKDSLSTVDTVSISVSNALSEIFLASLYIVNDDSTTELLTLLNKSNEALDGQSLGLWMELLRKLENINNTVFFTSRVDTYVTLLSNSGKVGYTNYSIEENKVKEYLQKYDSNYIMTLGTTIKFVGIERDTLHQKSGKSPYVVTWVKSVESKKGTGTVGCLVVSVPVDDIAKLMATESVPTKRALLDGNGKVIASTEKDWLMLSFDSIYNEKLMGKGYITTKGGDDVQSILTYEDINKDGWMIVDIKPLSDLSDKLVAVSKRLLLLNLGSILIFLVVAAVIARGITVPLRKLSKTMRKTDLNVNSKFADKMNRDEVYILEHNFDEMRSNIQTLMQDNIEKEKKKREAELKALQSQISPHFLFNTLNSVRCAIETDKKDKASQIIVALIGLLKMTLVKGDSFIPLKQEIENLKNYIKILQMRHGIPFSTYFDIPEIIEDYKVPKLLLQPVVENSIIHGFEGLTHEGLISVTAELTANNVIIYIYDNGKGMDKDMAENPKSGSQFKFSGIGINNVDQRIKAHYGDEYGIKYKSTPDEGTTAEITLPGLDEEMG